MLPSSSSSSSSLASPPFNHRKSRETSVNKSTAACATLSSFLQQESSSSSSSCFNQKSPSVNTQKLSSSSSASSWIVNSSSANNNLLSKSTASISRDKLKGIGSRRQVVVEETDEKVVATPPATVTTTSPSPGHAFISDLLDKYEVHRISMLLDHYIETSCQAACCDGRRRPRKSGRSNVKKKPPLPPVGLWLMRQTSLCRSRATDVVEESTTRIGGCSSSRWLLKQ
ncbi:unnamed protein product [Cuscuta europaea]|uniref:Uncharacterized protein n=1 Tax=Cuscuta europaea TaxID=41803 RepID=A0A9P0ZKE8_CUSEU|nr:unnamed protein product [Cuscuta europaea]